MTPKTLSQKYGLLCIVLWQFKYVTVRIGTSQNTLLILMLRSQRTGMMRLMENGSPHPSPTLNTRCDVKHSQSNVYLSVLYCCREHGSLVRSITQNTRENGYTHKSTTLSIPLMISCTDMKILVTLDLICGR